MSKVKAVNEYRKDDLITAIALAQLYTKAGAPVCISQTQSGEYLVRIYKKVMA